MRRLVFALSLAAVCAPAAHAQEIVVTAERRGVDAKRIPSNAARLDADALQTVGAQAATEALNRLPGVAFHRGSGAESLPAVRSPVLTGGQGAGEILVLEDGVPIRAPGFANINQVFETSLDFAQAVELTRGPGSALYGANAVHGVLNVITPGAEAADRGEIEIGQFGRRSVSGVVTRGALIAAGSARKDEGWRDQAGLEEQHALVGVETDLAGWSVSGRLAFVNLAQETAGFVEGADAYKVEALARANANPEAFRDSKALRASARLERAFGEHVRVQITPFARWIDTDLLLHFFPSRALEESGQTGGGVLTALYVDPSPNLSLIAGVDLDVTRGRLREFQARPTQPAGYVQGLHYDYEVDATVLAAYGQASWTFAPAWRVVAGLRGEATRYSYDNKTTANDVGRFRRPTDRDDAFDTLTPKLGVIREFDAGSAWLNFAQGARAPQVTDLYSLQTLQRPGDQKAETINSVELGTRLRIGRARIETALYAMEKKNAAFRNADGFTVPFARTRHRGVEVSGDVPVTDDLTLSGWITYARHTYAFSDPSTRAGEAIRSGDDVDTAPRWLWSARANWRATPKLSTEIEWTHMGEYFTNAANTRVYPGHDVVNLRARYALTPRVEIAAALRNVGDVAYAERADFAFGNDRYFPGEPRALSVSLAFKN